MHCDPHPGNVLVRRKDLTSSEVEVVLLDHGLYQQLTDTFRLTYCRLWQALITKDMTAIKKHCLELNAGELYPLLACVVTARTWENIEGGIASTERTATEVTMQYSALHLLSFSSLGEANSTRRLQILCRAVSITKLSASRAGAYFKNQ